MCYNVTMRKGSVINDNETYINSALIATYAVNGDEGFKPHHYKFFLELISNWMSSFFSEGGIFLQNTQIIRQLNRFEADGVLKKKDNYFFLTKGGLIDLLEEITAPASVDKLDVFYFKYHFIIFYKDILLKLIHNNRKSFPKSYEIELNHYFNASNLIEAQKEIIQDEIRKLRYRIDESKKQHILTRSLLKEGKSIDDIILEIEKKYPYELNHQKRMNELFSLLSSELKYKEIVDGPSTRINTLWLPSLRYLESFYKELILLEKNDIT